MALIISKIGEDTPREDRELYELAIARAPEDNLLRTRYAQYLEAMGFRSEAIAECQRVCELLPDFEWPHYTLGDLLVRAGRYGEAAQCFRRALKIRSDFTQAQQALRQLELRHPAAAGSGN
jgi:tetratricopeptide (TPR) repeat protein